MHILDILTVCLKKKFYLICVPLACALIAFAIGSVVPKTYYTEVRMRIDDPISPQMPSIPSSLSGNLSSFFGDMGKNPSEELFLELLGGRENLILAIEKFSLDTLYKTKAMELTIKAFRKNLAISVLRSNVIICGFKDGNRDLAIAIVRTMVENANNRFISLQKERLAMSTAFLNDRRNQLMDSLEFYSKELIEFYRDNNVINIENQIELTLLTLARYEEQINTNRVNEIITRGAAGSNSPLSQELRARNQVLQQEFQKIRGSFDEDYKPSKQSVLINTDWGLDKMLFEQVTKNKIGILKDFSAALSKELALSEAQLSKNIPAVQFIQNAYYPDWKIAPKRASWMIVSFGMAFILTLAFIILSAFVKGELEGASENNRQKTIKLLRAIWR